MIRSSRRVDVHQMGVFYINYALVENIKQHREPSDGHEVASQVHGGRDFRMTKASRSSGTAGKSVWASGKTSGGDAPRNGRNICVIVIPNPVEQAMFLCILGSRGRQAAPSGRGTRGAGGGGGRECRRGSSRPAGSPEAPGKASRFLPRSLGERGPAQPLGADRRGRKLHFAVPGYQARGGLCRSSRNLRQGCRTARGRLHGVSAEGCRVPLNQSLHFWSHCPEAAPSSGPFLIVSFEIQGPRGCPSSHAETPEESVFVTRLAV